MLLQANFIGHKCKDILKDKTLTKRSVYYRPQSEVVLVPGPRTVDQDRLECVRVRVRVYVCSVYVGVPVVVCIQDTVWSVTSCAIVHRLPVRSLDHPIVCSVCVCNTPSFSFHD